MNTTYDLDGDIAYIQLKDQIGAGGVAYTYPCDPAEVKGMIHLDFDAEDRLVGIEVMSASQKLPIDFLDDATRIGDQSSE
jgi:uncharacterized protein YuzE